MKLRNKQGKLTRKTKKVLKYSGLGLGIIALGLAVYTLTRKTK